MKILVLVLTLISLLFSNAIITKEEKKTNKVIATVNGVKITQFHIDAFVNSKLQKTFFHKRLSNEKREELNKEALEEIIRKELLYNFAKKEKITVDKEILLARKNKILNRYKTLEEFEVILEKNNLTMSDLERDIEAEELMKVLYQDYVKTEFTDDDLLKYYEANKYKFVMPESKNVQIILVNIDPAEKDGINVAKKKAQEALDKIKKGEDFGEIAKTYSNDLSRINGGNLGFIHEGTLVYLDKNATNLKMNEVSEIIETDVGFYIIKLLDKKGKTQLAFEKIKAKLKKDLKVSREKEKLNAILKQEKDLSKIVKF